MGPTYNILNPYNVQRFWMTSFNYTIVAFVIKYFAFCNVKIDHSLQHSYNLEFIHMHHYPIPFCTLKCELICECVCVCMQGMRIVMTPLEYESECERWHFICLYGMFLKLWNILQHLEYTEKKNYTGIQNVHKLIERWLWWWVAWYSGAHK